MKKKKNIPKIHCSGFCGWLTGEIESSDQVSACRHLVTKLPACGDDDHDDDGDGDGDDDDDIYNGGAYVCLYVCHVFAYFAFPCICSLTGTCPLSLVRAREAFHFTFDYAPLHFQHIMMIRIVMIIMIE